VQININIYICKKHLLKDHIINEYLYSIFITNIESRDLESNSIYLSNEEKDKITKYVSHKRKLEYSSVRYLLKKYIGNFSIQYTKLGAPYLAEGPRISISHSHNFALITKTNKQKIGIDIEKIQDKIKRITSKFLNTNDIENLEKGCREINQITYTKIWCCKEAIYKICSNNNINLKENITIKLLSSTNAKATVNYNNTTHSFALNLYYLDDYIIAVVVK
jgi:phosphopantetheinyl transferase